MRGPPGRPRRVHDGDHCRPFVAQKQKGPGIQSAAGLIRYFDAEEDSSFKIKPSYVLVFSAIVGIVAIMMRIYWRIN